MVHTATVKVAPTLALICEGGLFAEGLVAILEKTPFKITFRAANPEAEALESLDPGGKLIVLVGGQAASQIVETVRSLRGRRVSAYILVIGATAEPQEIGLALEAGADGFLRQTATSETLMMAIELAVRGETVLPTAFVKTLRKNNALIKREIRDPRISIAGGHSKADLGYIDCERIVFTPALSSKEESILQLLAEGAANKLIAQKLEITEATVKVHVKAILRKIRAKNRTQAAIWALEHYAARQVSNALRQKSNGHT